MSTNYTTQQLAILNDSDLLNQYLDLANITNSDEMEEAIGFADVIFYTTAIAFLLENDPSLQESLTLASDMGFEAKDLNSEKLATILLQDMLNQEVGNLI